MKFQFKTLALPIYFVLCLMIWILVVKIVGAGDDDEGVFVKMVRCGIMIEFSKSN